MLDVARRQMFTFQQYLLYTGLNAIFRTISVRLEYFNVFVIGKKIAVKYISHNSKYFYVISLPSNFIGPFTLVSDLFPLTTTVACFYGYKFILLTMYLYKETMLITESIKLFKSN